MGVVVGLGLIVHGQACRQKLGLKAQNEHVCCGQLEGNYSHLAAFKNLNWLRKNAPECFACFFRKANTGSATNFYYTLILASKISAVETAELQFGMK